MIIVLKHGASADEREHLVEWIKNLGIDVHVSDGSYQTVLGLIGNTDNIDADLPVWILSRACAASAILSSAATAASIPKIP